MTTNKLLTPLPPIKSLWELLKINQNIGVLLLSPNNHLLYANKASEKILGRHLDLAQNLPLDLSAAIETSDNINVYRPGGGKVNLHVESSKFEWDGIPTKLLLITYPEFQENEESSQFSEVPYKSIIEDSTEMISRSTIDCVRTFVNEQYCHSYSKTFEEIVGTSFLDDVYYEDRQEIYKAIRSLTFENPVITQEIRGIKRGKIRWESWSTRGLFKEQKLVGFQSVGRDIHEQKLAQEELKYRNEALVVLDTIAGMTSSLQSLDQILDVTLSRMLTAARMDAGWIYLYDKDTHRANFAVEHGLPGDLAELIKAEHLNQEIFNLIIQSGKPIIITVHDEDFLRKWNLGNMVINNLDVQNLICAPLIVKDEPLGILACYSSRFNKSRQIDIQFLNAISHQTGLAIYNARLMNEFKEIENLRSLDKLKTELIDTVSHEFRTPLGLIMLYTTTMLRNEIKVDHETQLSFLNSIQEETQKLQGMVEHTLELSRLETHQMFLERSDVDLKQLVSVENSGEL